MSVGLQSVQPSTEHICRLYTARISVARVEGYEYINTTVKSATGLGVTFAPTWDMVMSSKRGEISWDTYTSRYYELLRSRWGLHQQDFVDVLRLENPVLMCYCHASPEKKCHRYLLADILKSVARSQGISFEYCGELAL